MGGITQGCATSVQVSVTGKETQIVIFAEFAGVDPNFKVTLAPALPRRTKHAFFHV